MQSLSALGRKLLKEGKILHFVPAVSAPLSAPDTKIEIYKRVSFNGTLIVVFAAFLASVLCTLAVRSMVRCVFRGRRQMMEISLSPDAAHAHTGNNYGSDNCSKRSDMKALPGVLYKSMGLGTEGIDKDCAICLAEFVEGEKLKVVPQCNHSFHVECIDKWLLCNPSCPSCRLSLLL